MAQPKTKTELLTMIRCLRAARNRLECRESFFICDALHSYNVDCPTKAIDTATDYLVGWIDQMLHHRFSFNEWYTNKEVVRYDYHHAEPFLSQVQSLRIQWIDWMINELQTEIKDMK